MNVHLNDFSACQKILIANRGEIACRLIRTCRKLGIETVAIYSVADKNALHVAQADEAVFVGQSVAKKSYLNQQIIIDAALNTSAQAIIPGYGFLSENPQFISLCEQNGLIFIGPTNESMQSFALKHTARIIADNSNVPLIPRK